MLHIFSSQLNKVSQVSITLGNGVAGNSSKEKTKMTYQENKQCRKWLITINNPEKHGYTIKRIKEIIASINPLYACYSTEVGSQGTKHIHIFIYRTGAIRFKTLKDKYFPGAHFDPARGSIKENRDYIAKEGKWKGTAKEETIIEGSFTEIGEMPEEKMDRAQQHAELIRLLKARTPLDTILEIFPSYALNINQIKALREQVLKKEFSNRIRDVKVIYIQGETGVGKTRHIYDKHGFDEVYRVTKYPDMNGIKFDDYDFQKVLVFDEFRNQIPISEMLMYLDIYPIDLPARYTNHTAAYEFVYVVSNMPFKDQYGYLKNKDYSTYKAWHRRFHSIYKMDENGEMHDITKEVKEIAKF